jgi:hypothetical protein
MFGSDALVPAIVFAFVAMSCAAGWTMSGSAVTVYPAPAEEKLSDHFELMVGGQRVSVYSCRVSAIPFNRLWPGHQRPLDQTELASFAYWDMSGPAEVEVVSHRPAESVAVRPTSRGIRAQVEGNRIRFRLDAPGPITVEVNGTHHALHLFASAMAPAPPSPEHPSVRYFGPGVHRPGRMTLESNQTIYIAGGAIVHGAIQATGASDIKILGRGILDTSTFERGQGGGCIRLTDCRNVVIDGVILRDPDVWCLSTFGCSNVTIADVKLVGLWRYNSDGIDICNSQDVLIRNSFVRSFDDSIAIKGLRGRGETGEPLPIRGVTVERCVVWNDWGRALEIGAETVAPEITDITFRDCDILRTDFAAMDIQHGDRAAIRNVLYEDIRLEIDDVNFAPTIQQTDDAMFEPQSEWCPRLLIVEIVSTMWNRDSVRGTVDNVTLRDIAVMGGSFPLSRIQGFDAEHQVRGVTVQGLRFNGELIKSVEEAKMILRPFVQDVHVLAP